MEDTSHQHMTNLAVWQKLHEGDYFQTHPVYSRYGGLLMNGIEDVKDIQKVKPLREDMRVVVIGCGYGRETVAIAKRVKSVVGIDVSYKVLSECDRFLSEHGVRNFVPVLVSDHETYFANDYGLDVVYSKNVFQHISRKQSEHYIQFFVNHLNQDSFMLVQFAECGGTHEPGETISEPNVLWTAPEIQALAVLLGVRCEVLTMPLGIDEHPDWKWHFATFRPS